MEIASGAQFARLVLSVFDAMVDEVRDALAAQGHPDLTVANELAMQAIDGGADSAASLARATGVSRQAAAKTISSLEALGYVTRGADAADGRRKSLSITPSGRDAVAIGAAAFDAVYERWRAADPDAAAVTAAALRRLVPTDQ